MKYFLYDSKTGDSIEASNAEPVSLLQAIAILSRLEFDADTFFGLIRDDGRVLQFAGDEGGRTRLDGIST